jgi:predicted SnoaL-like aldol condensation-catalyzing enzyme
MATSNPTQDNKALVLAGITGVFIDRDATVLDRLFSDDYRQHNPQIPNGPAAIKSVLQNLSPEFKYQSGVVVADGDYVMVHGRYVGWGPKPMVGVDIFRRRPWQDRRTLGCFAGRGPGYAERQWKQHVHRPAGLKMGGERTFRLQPRLAPL